MDGRSAKTRYVHTVLTHIIDLINEILSIYVVCWISMIGWEEFLISLFDYICRAACILWIKFSGEYSPNNVLWIIFFRCECCMDVGQLAHSGRIFRGEKTKKQNKKRRK